MSVTLERLEHFSMSSALMGTVVTLASNVLGWAAPRRKEKQTERRW